MDRTTIIAWACAAMVAGAAIPARADVFNMTGAGTTNLEFVTVGNAGNVPDTATGHGAVNYSYAIGKYEVTAAQYCEFLNAKAKSDPYGLYNTLMVSEYGCRIERIGMPGFYDYSIALDRQDRPVNYVGFWDACRFVNWLTNGQGDGDTEDGSYFLNGYNDPDGATITRKMDAVYALPTEDEWYKAAYHKNDGVTDHYWTYPTQSHGAPTAVAPPGTTEPPGSANYYTMAFVDQVYYMTEVGAYTLSPGAYDTFDQGGNVWEWNEEVVDPEPGVAARQMRGGSFGQFVTDLPRTASFSEYPSSQYEDEVFGFRIVRIPEPAMMSVLLVGAVMMLRRRILQMSLSIPSERSCK